MKCSGVTISQAAWTGGKLFEHSVIDQDVKNNFSRFKAKSVVRRDLCSVVFNQVSVLEEKEG